MSDIGDYLSVWLDALEEADAAYAAQPEAVRERIEGQSFECEIAQLMAYFATMSPCTRRWLADKIQATLAELDGVEAVRRPWLRVVSDGRSC